MTPGAVLRRQDEGTGRRDGCRGSLGEIRDGVPRGDAEEGPGGGPAGVRLRVLGEAEARGVAEGCGGEGGQGLVSVGLLLGVALGGDLLAVHPAGQV